MEKKSLHPIREIMSLTSNVHEAYKKAPPAMKRLYMSLFYDGFRVRDKQIVKAMPTKLIKQMMEEKDVIITNNWLRRLYDVRTYLSTGLE